MDTDFSAFFFQRISSLASLMIVIIIAAVLGAVIIHQSQKLQELQKPLPLYIKVQAMENDLY